ncbi:uncharacterized protein [Hyperolius riggenbachi]|uniref:uncharacterized protein isoform X2 n=1 Tax=Hyperolius riggenbachi TaxID=752182 RepID=UPI0035A38F95
MYPTMEEMGKKAFCSDVALDYKVEDNCASLFVLVTKFDGTDRYYFIRTALRSEECNRTGSISAPRMNISYSTSCCSLNNCLPLRSPLPPKKNTTRNGILCPACYSEEQKCMATHSIECTGEETSCMTYVSHSAFGEPPVSYSGGCASRDVCGHARSLPFLVDVYTAHNISCAPENSTNLKPGHFLWCITCFTYNSDDCWGDAILCSHSDDACVQEHIRTIHDGWDVTELTKRCGTSKECGRVGSFRSAEKTMLVNTSCCYGSKCRTPATTLPSISDRDNGLICPGCYVSKSDRCTRFNNIKCTGNETRCMRYVKTESDRELAWLYHG